MGIYDRFWFHQFWTYPILEIILLQIKIYIYLPNLCYFSINIMHNDISEQLVN